MADLIREENDLVLKLTTIEKVEGIHGDIRVPISAVQSINVLDDAIDAVHGMKLPGTSLPGVLAIGTFVPGKETIFAVVHHHTKRGLKVNLRGTTYNALIIGVDNPEGLVASLGFATN